METRMLGGDLEVSCIGFGCMGFSHAYGPATEKPEAIEVAALDAALDRMSVSAVFGGSAIKNKEEK